MSGHEKWLSAMTETRMVGNGSTSQLNREQHLEWLKFKRLHDEFYRLHFDAGNFITLYFAAGPSDMNIAVAVCSQGRPRFQRGSWSV